MAARILGITSNRVVRDGTEFVVQIVLSPLSSLLCRTPCSCSYREALRDSDAFSSLLVRSASPQAPYRSFPDQSENKLTLLWLLFPQSHSTLREPCCAVVAALRPESMNSGDGYSVFKVQFTDNENFC